MEMSEESIMHHSSAYPRDRRVARLALESLASENRLAKNRMAAAAAAACLALACLTVPGFDAVPNAWADAAPSDADAAGAASTDTASTDATDAAPAEEPAIFTVDPNARAAATSDGSTQTLNVAGVRVTVPADLELAELGGVVVARDGAECLVVSVSLSTMTGDAADEARMKANFASIAQTVAGELGAALADFGATALTGGTDAYLYELEYTQDGAARTAGLCFVPTGGTSFALVQIAVDGSDQDMLAKARAVADSIEFVGAEAAGATSSAADSADAASTAPAAPMDEVASVISAEESAHATHADAAASAASTEATGTTGTTEATGAKTTVTVGGITFELPADFTNCSSSSSDECSWVSPDGSVTIGAIPSLIEDVSGIGTSAIGLVAEGIIEGVGGTTASHTVLTNGNTDVEVYVFTFTSSSVDFAGVLGIVVLPDNSVTALLSLTPAAAAAQHDPMITEILQSVRVE